VNEEENPMSSRKPRLVPLLSLLVSTSCLAQKPVRFDDYFADRTMRVDYYHTGNAREEVAALDQVYEQGIWAGSRTRLTADSPHGRYRVKVLDSGSGALLFERAFDSIFGEYETTTPAKKGTRRTYHESALVPYPLKPVHFVLERRGKEGRAIELLRERLDPKDHRIRRVALDAGVKVFTAHKSGDPHAKVDVAILGEGYTAEEEGKFERDLRRFTDFLFGVEPFKSHKDRFNVYGVLKHSQESGASEPSHGAHRKTALGASFDALGSERYILTEDNKALRDIAAHVPYDTLFIMVNHKRYGGGGIYNLYSTFTTDNQWSAYVFVHEFGHTFGGLADEYYTSSTAYNDFYPKGTEPTEPNITALLDPGKLKWRALVTPGTAVPTPWEKAGYDRMDRAYQKKRTELNEAIARRKRAGAPAAEVRALEEESERISTENGKQVDGYLEKSRFAGQVGAFLGAGYSSEGLYRPMLQCIMFSRGLKPFCKVCEGALLRAIESYGED
jgi:hypothetical protein